VLKSAVVGNDGSADREDGGQTLWARRQGAWQCQTLGDAREAEVMPCLGPVLLWLVITHYWGWWQGYLCTITTVVLTGYCADLQFKRWIHSLAEKEGLVDVQEVRLGGFKDWDPTIWAFSDIKCFCGRDSAGREWEIVAGYNARFLGFLLSVQLIRFRERETPGSDERNRES
jgi:hypothetical protein